VFWVRIDNRLVHGQIVETWLPHIKARGLVVANDELADDPLRQEIMSLAVPGRIKLVFCAVDSLTRCIQDHFRTPESDNILVLFASCLEARRAYDKGFHFQVLNLGNIHYASGKNQICPHIALSGEDESCLSYLTSRGVDLDFRCVPNDPVQVRYPL
jgi:PTS system mannose-specific IIB component